MAFEVVFFIYNYFFTNFVKRCKIIYIMVYHKRLRGNLLMKNKELRELAKQRMEGKMGKAFGISVVYFIMVFLINFVCAFIPFIGSLASTLLATPLLFGWTKQMIVLANGENVGVMDFFKHGFENFGKVWCSNLWVTLKCVLPIVLLIVSSILPAFGNGILNIISILLMIISFVWLIDVALKYIMLNYTIAYDREGLRARDIVSKSAKEAKGNIWQFMCMGIYYGLQIFAAVFLVSIVSGIIGGFLANINFILSLGAIFIMYIAIVALALCYSIRNIASCNELYKQNILSKQHEEMNV